MVCFETNEESNARCTDDEEADIGSSVSQVLLELLRGKIAGTLLLLFVNLTEEGQL